MSLLLPPPPHPPSLSLSLSLLSGRVSLISDGARDRVRSTRFSIAMRDFRIAIGGMTRNDKSDILSMIDRALAQFYNYVYALFVVVRKLALP